MEILFWLIFIVIGALWMKKNGLSWIEGALWGGVLTFVGLIVIYFRIRSSKKNPKLLSESKEGETSEIVSEDKELVGTLIRQQATKQILYGLAWWSGSAIAMYVALQSTGSTVYWFGGAIGALFHWYRAYKLSELSRKSNISILKNNDYILIGATILIVIGTFSKIVPEYFRIDVPTVGTCWAKSSGGLFAPVACWSPDAEYQTKSFSSYESGCGNMSFFKPSARESRYTCIEEINTNNVNS
jgi:O-antigen/teichoic acid export membrane protein